VPEGRDLSAVASAKADWKENVNPKSLEVLTGCKVEPSLAGAKPLDRFQFERLGYFCVDRDSGPGRLVFNRTVTLRDEWAKIQKSQVTSHRPEEKGEQP
jgi:glutaminyl-tRNA synthetase